MWWYYRVSILCTFRFVINNTRVVVAGSLRPLSSVQWHAEVPYLPITRRSSTRFNRSLIGRNYPALKLSLTHIRRLSTDSARYDSSHSDRMEGTYFARQRIWRRYYFRSKLRTTHWPGATSHRHISLACPADRFLILLYSCTFHQDKLPAGSGTYSTVATSPRPYQRPCR